MRKVRRKLFRDDSVKLRKNGKQGLFNDNLIID